MEPLKPNRPGFGLFLLMTAVYFGAYFGLKYGLLGGELPIIYNVLLIGLCLALALGLKGRFSR